MTAATWPLFLVAAAAGAVARVALDQWVHERLGEPFRWGTFVVNVSGSLALGVVTGLALEHGLGDTARTVAGTGALGAYTTFSTFSAEAVHLVETGRPAAAVRYVGATVVTGLAAAAAGLAVTGAL